jgi:DNA-binding NtrC family response regulator
LGYEVISALGSLKALEVLADSSNWPMPLDLLITDLKMPEINGLELIQATRKVNPGLPAVLITAHGDESIQKSLGELELCEYLEKPFNIGILFKFINALSENNL